MQSGLISVIIILTNIAVSVTPEHKIQLETQVNDQLVMTCSSMNMEFNLSNTSLSCCFLPEEKTESRKEIHQEIESPQEYQNLQNPADYAGISNPLEQSDIPAINYNFYLLASNRFNC